MSNAALQMRGPVGGTTDAKKVAVGSSVGAVIETYDFIGFGTAAALYFGTAFFPSEPRRDRLRRFSERHVAGPITATTLWSATYFCASDDASAALLELGCRPGAAAPSARARERGA